MDRSKPSTTAPRTGIGSSRLMNDASSHLRSAATTQSKTPRPTTATVSRPTTASSTRSTALRPASAAAVRGEGSTTPRTGSSGPKSVVVSLADAIKAQTTAPVPTQEFFELENELKTLRETSAAERQLHEAEKDMLHRTIEDLEAKLGQQGDITVIFEERIMQARRDERKKIESEVLQIVEDSKAIRLRCEADIQKTKIECDQKLAGAMAEVVSLRHELEAMTVGNEASEELRARALADVLLPHILRSKSRSISLVRQHASRFVDLLKESEQVCQSQAKMHGPSQVGTWVAMTEVFHSCRLHYEAVVAEADHHMDEIGTRLQEAEVALDLADPNISFFQSIFDEIDRREDPHVPHSLCGEVNVIKLVLAGKARQIVENATQAIQESQRSATASRASNSNSGRPLSARPSDRHQQNQKQQPDQFQPQPSERGGLSTLQRPLALSLSDLSSSQPPSPTSAQPAFSTLPPLHDHSISTSSSAFLNSQAPTDVVGQSTVEHSGGASHPPPPPPPPPRSDTADNRETPTARSSELLTVVSNSPPLITPEHSPSQKQGVLVTPRTAGAGHLSISSKSVQTNNSFDPRSLILQTFFVEVGGKIAREFVAPSSTSAPVLGTAFFGSGVPSEALSESPTSGGGVGGILTPRTVLGNQTSDPTTPRAWSDVKFSVREGETYQLGISFIVRGPLNKLKMALVFRRSLGKKKMAFSMGTFPISPNPYIFKTEEIKAPAGVLDRGLYKVDTSVSDFEDNPVADFCFNLEIVRK